MSASLSVVDLNIKKHHILNIFCGMRDTPDVNGNLKIISLPIHLTPNMVVDFYLLPTQANEASDHLFSLRKDVVHSVLCFTHERPSWWHAVFDRGSRLLLPFCPGRCSRFDGLTSGQTVVASPLGGLSARGSTVLG